MGEIKKAAKEGPPVVSFKEELAGRETLAAIASARTQEPHPFTHRGPATTKHYGDRISNAPGAMSPKVAKALDTAPDISVSIGYAGRTTQAVMDADIRPDSPEIEITIDEAPEYGLDVSAAEIEQVHSFVIRAVPEQLASMEVQQKLLEERLLHRMPGCFLEDVTDVAIRPWSEGTVLIRVSSRVS